YNSDLVSLASSFEFLAMQNQNQRKIAIVSDLAQVGNQWATIYSEVAKLVVHYRFEFIGVGPTISQYQHLFPDNSKFFSNTQELVEYLKNNNITDATLLFKGSRLFRFEDVINRLQEKMHRTVLEIDLNQLVANLRFFRTLLKPGTRVIAMLKAFGYGSGSFELANILQHHRVDYLAVAFTHEGVYLRQQGIKIPIMVMNPGIETCRDLVEFKLEPVIYSFDFLQEFSVFVSNNTIARYPVHVKIDTGMNRAGFRLDDIENLIRQLLQHQELKVTSIFSHLAAADDPYFDSFTLDQIRMFDEICSRIGQAIGNNFFKHILNSAGIERFNQYQFDAVRLGIGLYGVSFNQNVQLQPINF
ncbi:MAG TPA: alanine racemase, partial [Salinivirgaceae bacterium]|nr:alanine racemase [Salinivirgaceae bacterium]